VEHERRLFRSRESSDRRTRRFAFAYGNAMPDDDSDAPVEIPLYDPLDIAMEPERCVDTESFRFHLFAKQAESVKRSRVGSSSSSTPVSPHHSVGLSTPAVCSRELARVFEVLYVMCMLFDRKLPATATPKR